MNVKHALIIGIRNEESIAFAIARELKKAGYEILATFQDDGAYPVVKRAADEIAVKKLYKYDARKDADLSAFGDALNADGFRIDALVHAISYSTASGAKLNQPLITVDWEDFTDAIRVGAFSLVEVTGKLIDCFNPNASVLTLTLRWSKVAVPGFNVVCAAKAALESVTRGLAQSLGKAKGITVNEISSGFVPTFSLSKVGNALELLEEAKNRSPLKTIVRKEDIATLALSILENRSITGTKYVIDTGVDIMGI